MATLTQSDVDLAIQKHNAFLANGGNVTASAEPADFSNDTIPSTVTMAGVNLECGIYAISSAPAPALFVSTVMDAINFEGANLKGADLTGASVTKANLSLVNLNGADLTDANLAYSNLNAVDLRYATLEGTNLFLADLRNAQRSETVVDATTVL